MLQIIRGLALVIEIGLFTYAFRYLQLVDAHVMAALAPLMVLALAAPILGEKVGIRCWVAVSGGFLGVLIVLRPGIAVIEPIQIVPLIAAACFALFLVLTRMMARYDSVGTSTLYTGIVGLVALSVVAPMDWSPPTSSELGWLNRCPNSRTCQAFSAMATRSFPNVICSPTCSCIVTAASFPKVC